MSFFRAIWKNSSKHKKLYDEWALANAQDLETEEQSEEETFNLKYIGSTLVECAASEAATAEAVKTTLSLAKAGGKKMPRVSLSVNLRGMKVVNIATNEPILDISIYRISYCSADATHSQVFAFIATNDNETLECHAFLCPKRKVAQTVSLTVAQMFNTAFEMWQVSQNKLTFERDRALSRKAQTDADATRTGTQSPPLRREYGQDCLEKNLLIDFDVTSPRECSNWVNFDNDSVSNLTSNSRFHVNDKYMDSVGNGNLNNYFPTSWDKAANVCS